MEISPKDCFDKLSAIGTFITGLSAAFAAWRAQSELARWRNQQLYTKRAEVAGQALIAIFTFRDALQYMTRKINLDTYALDIGFQNQTLPTKSQRLKEIFDYRKSQINRDIQQYLDTWKTVEAYLDEETSNKFQEIWGYWAIIRLLYDKIIENLSLSEKGDQKSPSFENLYSSVSSEEFEKSVDLLKRQLKKLINLDPNSKKKAS